MGPPLLFPLLILLLLLIPPRTLPSSQNNEPFEQFVSSQHFPPGRAKKYQQQQEEPSFRANCSVPICEGSLAPIFCSGPLISSAWYFGVQQQCPGSKLLEEPGQIVTNFMRIVREQVVKKGDFLQFCEENFQNAAYLQPANLTDWSPELPNSQRISDPRMRKFAVALHQIWPSLTREFIDEVHLNQDRYPVLSVPNRFVVPGGFFKVYFYWDTFWILKGLYFSNLTKTAHGMLENFAHILHYHGFIPNSGNVQLSRRSQPPLFTQMVADYYAATKNRTFLAEFLPFVEKELDWWLRNRSILVEKDGRKHQMFQYKALTDCPRPENFLEDYQLGIQTADPQFFWSSTASACESGLDFSSRWYKWGTATRRAEEEMSRKLIATNQVLPVDLNVFMALNYWTLARFYGEELADQKKATQFRDLAQKLTSSINQLFLDEEKGGWFDFDLVQRELRTKFYPSNIYPLLLEGNSNGSRCQQVVDYLHASGALGFRGGIPSSLERNSNEQWDFPNGWAPQQHLFVTSLFQCRENAEARKIARNIADAFLTTAYNGFFNPVKGKPAQMWEKYDVRYDNGQSGFGGEYPPQSGFGWTNGVILEFIRMFHTSADADNEKEEQQFRSKKSGPDDGIAQQGQLFALDSLAGLLESLNQHAFHN